MGFDILIDNKFNPILIEINTNPQMKFSNILDKEIKNNLFIDTLNLVGLIPYSRISKVPLYNKFATFNNYNIRNALCELKRPKGDYDLIFPTKENINKYRKYFTYNNLENKRFWDKITSSR